GPGSPPRAPGYAVELWVQPADEGPNGCRKAELVALVADRPGPAEPHLALIELTAQSREPGAPSAVRYLDRWPAGFSGGVNVFSRRTFVPGVWHHLVGQKNGGRLELFLDGRLVATSPVAEAPGRPAEEPCRLLVGRLKQRGEEPD